jgi:hypothetical protein
MMTRTKWNPLLPADSPAATDPRLYPAYAYWRRVGVEARHAVELARDLLKVRKPGRPLRSQVTVQRWTR